MLAIQGNISKIVFWTLLKYCFDALFLAIFLAKVSLSISERVSLHPFGQAAFIKRGGSILSNRSVVRGSILSWCSFFRCCRIINSGWDGFDSAWTPTRTFVLIVHYLLVIRVLAPTWIHTTIWKFIIRYVSYVESWALFFDSCNTGCNRIIRSNIFFTSREFIGSVELSETSFSFTVLLGFRYWCSFEFSHATGWPATSTTIVKGCWIKTLRVLAPTSIWTTSSRKFGFYIYQIVFGTFF